MSAEEENNYAAKPEAEKKKGMIKAAVTKALEREFKKMCREKKVTQVSMIESIVNNAINIHNNPEKIHNPLIDEQHVSELVKAQLAEAEQEKRRKAMADAGVQEHEGDECNGRPCPHCGWGCFDTGAPFSFPEKQKEACSNCDYVGVYKVGK